MTKLRLSVVVVGITNDLIVNLLASDFNINCDMEMSMLLQSLSKCHFSKCHFFLQMQLDGVDI